MGQKIYVVAKQDQNFMNPGALIPVQAFSDYPTALDYATSIFKNPYTNMMMSPKDLIFLIPLLTASVSGV